MHKPLSWRAGILKPQTSAGSRGRGAGWAARVRCRSPPGCSATAAACTRRPPCPAAAIAWAATPRPCPGSRRCRPCRRTARMCRCPAAPAAAPSGASFAARPARRRPMHVVTPWRHSRTMRGQRGQAAGCPAGCPVVCSAAKSLLASHRTQLRAAAELHVFTKVSVQGRPLRRSAAQLARSHALRVRKPWSGAQRLARAAHLRLERLRGVHSGAAGRLLRRGHGRQLHVDRPGAGRRRWRGRAGRRRRPRWRVADRHADRRVRPAVHAHSA